MIAVPLVRLYAPLPFQVDCASSLKVDLLVYYSVIFYVLVIVGKKVFTLLSW